MASRLTSLKNKLTNSHNLILQKLFPSLFETKFYTDLFVKNEHWNSKDPNDDEQLRWTAIEGLILQSGINAKRNKIVEIGCGRGWMSNLLTQYGDVVAYDPIKPVINHAKKMFPDITFYSGKMSTLIEKKKLSNNYDIAVCSEVIEHIKENEQLSFIGEIRSILNPDGHLIISTPRKEILMHSPMFSNQPKEEWLSEPQLQKLLEANHFTPIKTKRIKMKYHNAIAPVYQVWIAKAN